MERLSMVTPELAKRIQNVSDERSLRLVARTAALKVVERVSLTDERIEDALQILNGSAEPNLRDVIQRLADELDERYFNLQEAKEAGRVSEEDYLEAFASARAVSAVACALDPDPLMAALEATYEAHCAFSDGSQVIASVNGMLDGL